MMEVSVETTQGRIGELEFWRQWLDPRRFLRHTAHQWALEPL